jgi:hypothetical protein
LLITLKEGKHKLKGGRRRRRRGRRQQKERELTASTYAIVDVILEIFSVGENDDTDDDYERYSECEEASAGTLRVLFAI